MASKTDFSEAEWDQLHKGAAGAGLLVSVSDRSFFDSFKEAGALAKHLAGARTSSDSELVRELSKEHGTGFGMTAAPDKVELETLEALRASIATLEAKSPEDAVAYRQFVLDVAESVGNAGGGGEDSERAAIEKIREALGATTLP
jgi:tellurite resistance protein